MSRGTLATDHTRSVDDDGVGYDRRPGLGLDPVTGIDPAGEPNGIVDIGDVLAALARGFVVACGRVP